MDGSRKRLSVCIASFGDDVSALLQELAYCESYGLLPGWDLEVLISDQFPQAHRLHTRWNHQPHTSYVHAPQSRGRSANRNLLAARATGTHLLFLDADAMPRGYSFLERYCFYLQFHPVVVGGTAYRPGYQYRRLRVRIGKIKEEHTPQQRMRKPYGSFSAFNFAIEKSAFDRVKFDESLTEYGHEDTLFGQELSRLAIPVLHVDNPAYHMGIDPDDVFVEKTERAVENLAVLMEAEKIDQGVALFRVYSLMKKVRLTAVFALLDRWWGKALKRRLSRGLGPLLLFDLFKLMRLSSAGEAALGRTREGAHSPAPK